MRKLLLFLVLVLVVGGVVLADDYAIEFPTGWITNDEDIPHAVSPTAYAVTAYKYTSDTPSFNIYDQSIVIQSTIGGGTYTTTFAGKVYALKYSLTGSHLLVHQTEVTSASTPGTRRVHLLDNQGQILWTVTDNRQFAFSTTGEILFAWYPGWGYGLGGGTTIELLDLAGNFIKQVSATVAPSGVVVVGDGSSVILHLDQSLICLDTTVTPPGELWRIEFGDYPRAIGLNTIEQGRFVVKFERAASAVVTTGGVLAYTYDPQALGTADPLLSPLDYASYRIYKGPTPGTATLFNGSSGTFTLDLSAGSLTPRPITVDRPSTAFTLEPDLMEQKLFFISRTEVRVRDVSNE